MEDVKRNKPTAFINFTQIKNECHDHKIFIMSVMYSREYTHIMYQRWLITRTQITHMLKYRQSLYFAKHTAESGGYQIKVYIKTLIQIFGKLCIDKKV